MTPVSADSIPLQARVAIERAASATGVDFGLLVETARRESSFNPNARAPTSSATGLFQFIESTWLDMVRRHGDKHGLGVYAQQIEIADGRAIVRDRSVRQQILDLRFDPDLSARMGAELARDNQHALERRLGRPVNAGEIYAAHVLGAGGAARLIEAAADGAPSAAALFPREADANRWLFNTRDGRERSAQALLERLSMPQSAAPGPGAMMHFASATTLTRAPESIVGLAAVNPVGSLRLAQSSVDERAAALMLVDMLIASTRARALSIMSTEPPPQDRDYAMSMYQRWAS